VLSVRSAGPSVLLVRSGRGGGVMVRRRSTVRFRKGAQGCEDYSNAYPVTTGVPLGALSGAFLDADRRRELGRCELRRTGERFRSQNPRGSPVLGWERELTTLSSVSP
jgi:hypothetical protein